MAGTVRFTQVVQAAGEPEVYLPLDDPERDKQFMRAVKEQRVMTLKQEPVGTRKDFGLVGFLKERYVTYLIFPKSLHSFAGRQVIGLKYDRLQQAGLATPAASSSAKPAARGKSAQAKPAKPKPEPPKPITFHVRVRLTVTTESEVTIHALTEREARVEAEKIARKDADFSHATPAVKILSLDS